jgi:excisionase family DNA binding protein
METKPNSPDVLTAKEAAAFLRINPWRLRELATQGEVPGKKVGGVWRFLRSKLVAYLEKG